MNGSDASGANPDLTIRHEDSRDYVAAVRIVRTENRHLHIGRKHKNLSVLHLNRDWLSQGAVVVVVTAAVAAAFLPEFVLHHEEVKPRDNIKNSGQSKILWSSREQSYNKLLAQ